MSKYSRTRKAVCRIGCLKEWPITRAYFKRHPTRTFRETYQRKRKALRKLGINELPKYKDALKGSIPIWNLV